MKMSRKLTIFCKANLLLSTILLAGCISTGNIYTNFPLDPDIPEFTVPPVIEQLENGNYVVTSELILRMTLYHEYIKLIDEWKAKYVKD